MYGYKIMAFILCGLSVFFCGIPPLSLMCELFFLPYCLHCRLSGDLCFWVVYLWTSGPYWRTLSDMACME
ncbi:hypothetical protein BDW69DRAFT_103980 [Aspergillus filifer]